MDGDECVVHPTIARGRHATRHPVATLITRLRERFAAAVARWRKGVAAALACTVLLTTWQLTTSSAVAVGAIEAPAAAVTREHAAGVPARRLAAPVRVSDVVFAEPISDGAQVISPSAAHAIQHNVIRAQEAGSQVVVVTLPRIEGGKPAAKRFATELFNKVGSVTWWWYWY